MKYLLPVFALLFCFQINGYAVPKGVEPVKIEPITKVAYNFEFYKKQAGLWKQEAEKNDRNANAWINYYRAARYANMLADSLAEKYDMGKIVGSMPAALANTFEFNYILFMHQMWTDEGFGHLLKAHELAPERTEAYHDLIAYHMSNGNQQQAAYFNQKLFAAGEYPPALMAWNYNMLSSVGKNGILLTHGDNDSYPAWAAQTVKNVRPDVSVLNVNLLMHDAYRERVFNEFGLAKIASEDYPEYKNLYLAIVRRFMQQGQRPLYVATSVPKFIRDALGDSLYLTGLAFKYSPRPFDNVAVLKNNYEKRFLKDHLRIQLEADTGSNVAASMNMHYLPAIILLRRHYTASGETSKAEELEPLIKRIATEAGKEEYIAQYLGQEAVANEDFVTSISVKNLDKELKKIRGKLYAFSTEVTNGQYEAFLMDLLKNKEYELLDICKSPKTDWRSLLPDEFKKLPDSEVFQNGPPDGARSPVQNISYEAAQEYCKWITKVYNRSDYKKKAHQKVFFRLPTEAEWVYAARADHDLAPYPWGGYSAKNAKGCFLANFEVASEPPCEDCPNSAQIDSRDGGFFPVVADAYFPNDFGLYNTSGNVAEMVAEKGIAKGGSWEDAPDQCTIDARKEYSKPSPAIGFRVFMEVLK